MKIVMMLLATALCLAATGCQSLTGTVLAGTQQPQAGVCTVKTAMGSCTFTLPMQPMPLGTGVCTATTQANPDTVNDAAVVGCAVEGPVVTVYVMPWNNNGPTQVGAIVLPVSVN